MKKLNQLIFVLTITLTVFISSCKKDDVSNSKKELLTSNHWKFLTFKYNGIPDASDNCEIDDFIIFSSNGTYTYDPTKIKCQSSESIVTGTWTLSSDEKKFTFDGVEMTIVELTESKLVISTIEDGDILETTFIAF